MTKKQLLITRIVTGTIYLGLLILFVYLSFSDGSKTVHQSNTVTNIVVDTTEAITGQEIPVTDNLDKVIRKIIGHYGYFVLIGLFSSMFYLTFTNLKYKFRAMIHYISGFLFAFITEFGIQAFIDGRKASFIDVLIDTGGFITLSTIIIVALYIVYNKDKKGVLKHGV